jgi:prepilin peptidase CpaA
MAAAAASDLARRRIPNALNVGILATGLVAQAAGGGSAALVQGLLGAAASLALLLPLFHFRWIGGGDVKLVAAAGAWLGPITGFWSTLFGLAAGGVVSIAIAVAGGPALRAEVTANLKNAALTLSPPSAPRRARGALVPMALPLAAAAVAVYFTRGSL